MPRKIPEKAGPRPTSLTADMGKLIRRAREQAGMTQAELAERIPRRQASLSDIENGRMDIDAGTLVRLADILQKPITSLFPPWIIKMLQPEEVTPAEEELLILARELSPDQLALVLTQVRALAEEHKRTYHEWLDEQEEAESAKRPKPKRT